MANNLENPNILSDHLVDISTTLLHHNDRKDSNYVRRLFSFVFFKFIPLIFYSSSLHLVLNLTEQLFVSNIYSFKRCIDLIKSSRT
jgi:hypothetical protein